MTARAIDGYRDSLFEKLDVRSRVGLAIYAVKNGIVYFDAEGSFFAFLKFSI